jgi:hypothetical protein
MLNTEELKLFELNEPKRSVKPKKLQNMNNHELISKLRELDTIIAFTNNHNLYSQKHTDILNEIKARNLKHYYLDIHYTSLYT